MEALRAYLTTLRKGRGVSQDNLASAIGLSRRAVLNWEKGETQTMKMAVALDAIRFLQGAVGDIFELLDGEVDRGVELARQRLSEPAVNFTEEQQSQLEALARSMDDDEFNETLRLIEELRRQNKTSEWLKFGRFLRG